MLRSQSISLPVFAFFFFICRIHFSVSNTAYFCILPLHTQHLPEAFWFLFLTTQLTSCSVVCYVIFTLQPLYYFQESHIVSHTTIQWVMHNKAGGSLYTWLALTKESKNVLNSRIHSSSWNVFSSSQKYAAKATRSDSSSARSLSNSVSSSPANCSQQQKTLCVTVLTESSTRKN